MANTRNKIEQSKSLSAQIKTLEGKLTSISGNEQKARQTLQTYQQQLDDAEQAVSQAVVNQMTNDCKKTQDTAQEARIQLGVVTQQYEQARNDLKYIPDATKKLQDKIKTLRTEIKQTRIAHIRSQTKLDAELIKQAQDALLNVMSFRALRADLDMSSMDMQATLQMLTTGEPGTRFRAELENAYQAMVKRLKLDKVA